VHYDIVKYEKTLENQGKMVATYIRIWYSAYRLLNNLCSSHATGQLCNCRCWEQRKLSKGIFCPFIWCRATRDMYKERISLVIFCPAA